MSERASKRVSFSADNLSVKKQSMFLKHGVGTLGIFSFGLTKSSKLSPVRVLRRLGAKVATVLCFVSATRKTTSSSSGKVSSESLARSRSRSLADTEDSQRAEAIEDCIEFLNSSSSMSRPNPVSAD
ncbi:hypothetical protein K2173_019671 [Erythroxylum novogranatense]|uniref:Josephin-like protein n=1 Tax=Erythroxylum novogranatense TaxID=1862640 RepID=A0AAV8UGN0_9ROSI|nr:hypothetical protein K2173_019671 [Erythroxylum novogranatense]